MSLIKAITLTEKCGSRGRESVLYRRTNSCCAESVILGPFYGGYNVIALDREYRHALFAARTATTCGYSPARQPFLRSETGDAGSRDPGRV